MRFPPELGAASLRRGHGCESPKVNDCRIAKSRGEQLARALVFILVALATGVLIYWLVQKNSVSSQPASPPSFSKSRTLDPQIQTPDPQPPTVQRQSPDSQSSPPNRTPSVPIIPPAAGIPAPRTDKQKERDDLESRRAAFYNQVRTQAGEAVDSLQPKDEDLATLDVRFASDDPKKTTPLVDLIVKAGAYQNGFRHIRCFVPTPAGTLERKRLEAEANADDSGHWFIFRN